MAETESPGIESLVRSITQREWLGITRALDASKEDVVERQELMLPALAWVHEKRAHGGADWDRVLDMTDEQVVSLLGLNKESDEDPTPPAIDSGLKTTGTDSELSSVSPQESNPPSTTP